MLVRAAAYTTAIEAHLARMRLEVEGIPAFVLHEHHVWAIWMISLALGGVKVYVHRNDLDHAKAIIKSHDHGEYAIEEEQEVVCPHCQGSSVVRRRLSWASAMLTAHFAHIPLYFRWATLKCLQCGHGWDFNGTRAYPLSAIVLAAVAVVTALLAIVLLLYCNENLDPTSIFPNSQGCNT